MRRGNIHKHTHTPHTHSITHLRKVFIFKGAVEEEDRRPHLAKGHNNRLTVNVACHFSPSPLLCFKQQLLRFVYLTAN